MIENVAASLTEKASGPTVLGQQDSKGLQDVFLKMLSTELQNQNPLSPVDNSEWVSQLAQIHSLSQSQSLAGEIKELKSVVAFSQSANLVGKEIAYNNNSGTTGKGTVDSILQKNNEVFAVVGSEEIPIQKILSVK